MITPVLYLNGQLVVSTEARLSPLDAGFQYGDGAFETILSHEGRLQFRADHCERLRTTLSFLSISPPPSDADLVSAVEAVLHANRLTSGEARVKIIVSRGAEPEGPPTLCITALPYVRPSVTEACSIQTCVLPHPSPFARWKSLSYGMYRAAWLRARRDGFDDALFRTPDGSLLETSTAAVIVWDGERWLIAPAEQRLDSITARHVCAMLQEHGFEVEQTAPRFDDRASYGAVWLCNALRLVQPVTGIDASVIRGPAPLPPAALREALLVRGSHE